LQLARNAAAAETLQPLDEFGWLHANFAISQLDNLKRFGL
jgi:hypothetical protein